MEFGELIVLSELTGHSAVLTHRQYSTHSCGVLDVMLERSVSLYGALIANSATILLQLSNDFQPSCCSCSHSHSRSHSHLHLFVYLLLSIAVLCHGVSLTLLRPVAMLASMPSALKAAAALPYSYSPSTYR